MLRGGDGALKSIISRHSRSYLHSAIRFVTPNARNHATCASRASLDARARASCKGTGTKSATGNQPDPSGSTPDPTQVTLKPQTPHEIGGQLLGQTPQGIIAHPTLRRPGVGLIQATMGEVNALNLTMSVPDCAGVLSDVSAKIRTVGHLPIPFAQSHHHGPARCIPRPTAIRTRSGRSSLQPQGAPRGSRHDTPPNATPLPPHRP